MILLDITTILMYLYAMIGGKNTTHVLF